MQVRQGGLFAQRLENLAQHMLYERLQGFRTRWGFSHGDRPSNRKTSRKVYQVAFSGYVGCLYVESFRPLLWRQAWRIKSQFNDLGRFVMLQVCSSIFRYVSAK